MASIREYENRLQAILDALDVVSEQLKGDTAEQLLELNAEFEDALFMFRQIDSEDVDAQEELLDAIEEFDALRSDLSRLATETNNPAFRSPLEQFANIIEEMRNAM